MFTGTRTVYSPDIAAEGTTIVETCGFDSSAFEFFCIDGHEDTTWGLADREGLVGVAIHPRQNLRIYRLAGRQWIKEFERDLACGRFTMKQAAFAERKRRVSIGDAQAHRALPPELRLTDKEWITRFVEVTRTSCLPAQLVRAV